MKMAIVNKKNDYILMGPEEILNMMVNSATATSIYSIHFLTQKSLQTHLCYYTMILRKSVGEVPQEITPNTQNKINTLNTLIE